MIHLQTNSHMHCPLNNLQLLSVKEATLKETYNIWMTSFDLLWGALYIYMQKRTNEFSKGLSFNMGADCRRGYCWLLKHWWFPILARLQPKMIDIWTLNYTRQQEKEKNHYPRPDPKFAPDPSLTFISSIFLFHIFWIFSFQAHSNT